MSLEKYLGKWYELMHYDSFFESNLDYNTTAEYTLLPNGTVEVVNTTYSKNKMVTIKGIAVQTEDLNLIVNFPGFPQSDKVNYVVDHLWLDENYNYLYAVVTNPERSSFFLLSRIPNPSVHYYTILMNYVLANFDGSRISQVPHLPQ